MNSQDAQRDLMCFDLMDFDMKHPVFPQNAAAFIVQASSISTPQDCAPSFSDMYRAKVGELSDFDKIAFYSDFSRLMNARFIDTDIQGVILNFFEITFIPDPAIDLLCAEAFKPSPPAKRAKTGQSPNTKLPPKYVGKQQPKAKRGKNYNHPIVRARCENCAEKDIRFKLMKKMSTCKTSDLMKFDEFARGIKMENNLLATMPPINEVDLDLHEDMLLLMETRNNAEYHYLHEALPNLLNKIKLHWYENREEIETVINVPETESDVNI